MNKKERKILNKELNEMLSKLLNDVDLYYSKDLVLNSEGMKLLNRTIKVIIKLYPELRPLLNQVRSNPSYELVMKLASRANELNSSKD